MDSQACRLCDESLSEVQKSLLGPTAPDTDPKGEVMNETVPVVDGSAYRKAALIREALETLRAAHHIDERDDLDAGSFLEWYDRTIPNVRDIKILAGAMEVELAKRRGLRILAEGDRRKRPDAVTKVVTKSAPLSGPVRRQRFEERALGTHPHVVDAFVQQQANAGCAPTVHAAVRAAQAAQVTSTPPRAAISSRKVSQFQARQTRVQATNKDLLATLDHVADGLRRSDVVLAKMTGDVPQFLQRVRLVPWLTIDRTTDGTVFRIDAWLRAICDGAAPRPELSYGSVDTFLRSLRDDITRKRKENHDERQKARWNSQLILTRVQSDLLDWIEEQLDRVPTH